MTNLEHCEQISIEQDGGTWQKAAFMNLKINPQNLAKDYVKPSFVEIGFSAPANFEGLYYPMGMGLIEPLSETYYRLNFLDNAGYYGSIGGGQEWGKNNIYYLFN